MADWAIYRLQYLNESGADGEPVLNWLTSRDWLVNRLHSGDRVWLFIGGNACGDEAGPHRAYVSQLLVVAGWGNYEHFVPGESGSPRYRINGVVDRCILVEPPAEVDRIFRQPGTDVAQHIRVARQTPFELDGRQAAQILTLLSLRYPEVHAVATQV